LFLDISPQYGIVNGRPISVYDIKKIEGEDEEDPNEVYFEIEGGRTRYENFQIAHFKNISDLNFAPYGRSYLEGARSI